MLRPPAPVIRSSPFDVGALLNACIIIIIKKKKHFSGVIKILAKQACRIERGQDSVNIDSAINKCAINIKQPVPMQYAVCV